METPEKKVNYPQYGTPEFLDLNQEDDMNMENSNRDQNAKQSEMAPQEFTNNQGPQNDDGKNSEWLAHKPAFDQKYPSSDSFMEQKGNDSLGNPDRNPSGFTSNDSLMDHQGNDQKHQGDFYESELHHREDAEKNWTGQVSGRDGQWIENK